MTAVITTMNFDVSIIIPILNGENWIDDCFSSILKQTAVGKLKIEISIYNDNSTDKTEKLLEEWKNRFKENDIFYVISNNTSKSSKGVGFAKNAAVRACHGEYLCFQDIDDVMLPERIWKQYNLASKNKNDIIGSQFIRKPSDSTIRFTRWANNLKHEQLTTQIYTSHGPTVIMPTWFCHKDVFHKNGGFSEEVRGFPEDLDFFYKHITNQGNILRVDDVLLIYTYHQNSATFSVSSDTIWDIRIKYLSANFIEKCTNGFTIWNAGKQGKKFFKSLNDKYIPLVNAFCDVDVKKIGKHYEMYCPTKRKVTNKIPILHFTQAKPPFIICVKLDMTDGKFEENLSFLNLVEGTDYILFS